MLTLDYLLRPYEGPWSGATWQSTYSQTLSALRVPSTRSVNAWMAATRMTMRQLDLRDNLLVTAGSPGADDEWLDNDNVMRTRSNATGNPHCGMVPVGDGGGWTPLLGTS